MQRMNPLNAVLATVMAGLGLFVLYLYYTTPDFRYMQNATVKVGIVDRQTGDVAGHCSGVYLGDGYVLTAGHCVQSTDTYRHFVLSYDSEDRVGAEVVVSDWDKQEGKRGWLNDIGLLKVSREPDARRADLDCSPMTRIGEEVYAVGMPKMLRWTVTKGRIITTLPRPEWGDGNWLQLDITITGGNSGGPVFDWKGDVVGIVSHIMTSGGVTGRSPTGHAFAVSGPTICETIEEVVR